MPAARRPVVVDASVVVRWLVPERGSEQAVQVFRRWAPRVAPRLMLTEVAGALRRKVEGHEVGSDHAARALESLASAVGAGVVQLAADEDVIGAALRLALVHRHKVPDCVYLALAEQEGAALATADLRLAAIARERGVAVHLVPAA